MKILYCRPIKTNRISQNFGENRACVYPNGRVVGKRGGLCPVGSKDLYKSVGMLGHNGVDRVAWFKEPVYFSYDFLGWIKTEVDQAGGVGIDIVSKERVLKCNEPNCDETHYVKQRMWHHWEIVDGVWDKKEVRWGTYVANADSTGLSSGHHIHESLKWCNKYGDGIHNGKNGWLDNGYHGAFDPVKHPDIEIIDEFIIDYLKKEVEVKITEVQLSLIQILTKFIFILQEQIRKLKIGSIFQGR
ncbi:hypothetical protein IID22_02100 [Patescibacteria group bacterium]|nr:hypothetical protein [Patescibacteria group bacterium]